MARSQQFIDGWRCAEKRLVTWLLNRARQMSDPRATAILNVAASDFGFEMKRRPLGLHPREADDPAATLLAFRTAVRRDALEEAARIAEGLSTQSAEAIGDLRSSQAFIAAAIRAAKAAA